MDLVQNRQRLLDALYDVYIEGGNQTYPISLITEKLDLSEVQIQTAARELEEDHLVKGMCTRVPGPVDFIAITAEGRRHVEGMRSAPGPPQLVHVVLAGFTAEGRQEFFELFSQVSADEQEQFKQLIEALNDTSRSENDRLDKAHKLVGLLQNSNALLGALLGPHVPQAVSVLQQIFNQ
jgi:DNA-binding MarR family transcriptional regulator